VKGDRSAPTAPARSAVPKQPIMRSQPSIVPSAQPGTSSSFSIALIKKGLFGSKPVDLEMIAISGGKFWMGSPDGVGLDTERPRHEVTIAPFFMGKYPVTQAQYEAVMGWNPSYFTGFAREHHPVERVSWHDAIAFCQELSRWSDRQFGLPSEAQWEYACRAGTETPFYFGETISAEQVNYSNSNGTSKVGKFPANKFGLYDMHGNVWEWCADHWHKSYDGAPKNGSAWLTAAKNPRRLLRGGSWRNPPAHCRSAYRDHGSPVPRYNYFGFRVVCV
jgi:formylglycine-generating enzyme required for sulfatase activity